MSLTTRVLLALVAGLITGITATTFKDAGGGALIRLVEPVGSLWVNALQMTLIPLVASMLISVIASVPDARSTGRLGVRAFVVFTAFLSVTAVVSMLIGPALVAMLPIDPATTAALQASDAGAIATIAARMPTFDAPRPSSRYRLRPAARPFTARAAFLAISVSYGMTT